MLEALFDSITARAIIVAATCNAACALVGCFLVLRRMSLMGDALSHAVLPGLVIALVVTGSGGPLPMLLGAIGAGIVTTMLTRLTQKYGRIAPDASLGVVYTSLFALGVILVKQQLTGVHFDVACVYEGSLLSVAMDTTPIAGAEVPRALLVAAPVLIGLVGVLLLLWKEWKLTAFDPALAETMGFAPDLMHYLLMLLVSLVVMTSFESIGSILVIAMLIAPAAAAHLLTDRLAVMLVIATGLSTVATVAGTLVSEQADVRPAGCIALAAGLLYLAAALFGPRHGVLSKMLEHIRLALRVRREDLLARLYRRHEEGAAETLSTEAAIALVSGGWLGSRAVSQLVARGLVSRVGGAIELTDEGLATGRRLVRSHRLWETYLVEQVGVASDHVHDPAHRVEHFLDDQIDEEIQRTLPPDAQDPHGRAIPEKPDA